MSERRRIVVVTSTRFHLVDLTRELLQQGHDVRLVSYLPHAHVEGLGVPRAFHHSLLPLLAPAVALLKLPIGSALKKFVSERLLLLTDRLAARALPPCDVLIGLSGLCVATAKQARAQGAKTIVDSGSAHVGAALHTFGRTVISRFYERRERAAYVAADRIAVGSEYAARTFRERLPASLPPFVNPYGVDLATFSPTRRRAERPTLLFVGNWSRRKGCDLLVRAWERMEGVELLHVGSVVDLPHPTGPRFFHWPPVPQEQLPEIYSFADLLALPSRDDGYGLVLNQAAACGLDIVASDHCGAPDLATLVGESDRIRVFRSGDGDGLLAALQTSVAHVGKQDDKPRDWLAARRRAIGWSAYGERYSLFIDEWLHRG